MRQRTDSTHVLARIRELNRLELAGEAVRAALEALAAAAPGWLAPVIGRRPGSEVYGQRIDRSAAAGEQGGARGAGGAVRPGRVSPAGAGRSPRPRRPAARDLPAVQALRLILLQQFYRETGPAGEKVIWREDDQHGLPPGRAKLVSPYDLDARYGEKRGKGWTGYKAHYSETVSDPAGDDPQTGRPARPEPGHGHRDHPRRRPRRGDDRDHPRRHGRCRAATRRARRGFRLRQRASCSWPPAPAASP